MKYILTLALSSLTLCGAALKAADAPPPAVPPVLEPLNAKVGKHYAFKGNVLTFRAEAPITEEQWKALEGLGVHVIVTGGKGIDDAALARLVKLDPEGLILDGSVITDDGCKYLAEMKSLRWLSVGHTTLGKGGFSGTGFAQLKSLPKLERLNFGGTGADDQAMHAIGELTQLKEFNSWHTHFSVDSNPDLANFKNMVSMTLGNSMPAWNGKPRRLSLTDATLDYIAQMTSLETLTLMQARFTLPALEKLKALSHLKTLNLNNIDANPADIEKLKSEMPNVKITYKPLTDEEKAKLEDFLTHK